MKLQTACKERKRGWFLKENQTDLTTPQNPCSCCSLSEAGKCLLQGWCKPRGKALRMAIWTICTAENENWNKTKGNPYHFQESNVFRLKGVRLCYGWSISLPSRGLVHTSSDTAKSLAYNSTEQTLGLETVSSTGAASWLTGWPSDTRDFISFRISRPFAPLPIQGIPANRVFQQSLLVCNHYWKLDLA